MITFKAQVRKNQEKADGKSNIKIRISHNKKTRYLPTDFNVGQGQFDNTEGKVIPKKHDNASFINTNLRNQISAYEKLYLENESRVQLMDTPSLMAFLKNSIKGQLDFTTHLKEYCTDLREANRNSYASSIEQTLDRIRDFVGKESLAFKVLNYSFLQRFETYFLSKGMSQNSVNLHKRNMRTIFNDAINKDLIGLELYPFRKSKIKRNTTSNRNLRMPEIVKFFAYAFENRSEQRARDLFFLSFFLQGINMKDLLSAKSDQVKRGRLSYVRSKTGKELSVKLSPEALEIINRYKGKEEYLLNLMEKKVKNIVKKDRSTELYKDITDQTNRLLKTVGSKCGIGDDISTYWARHSWASIANELEIPKTVITMALGHSDSSVTDIYINTSQDQVDAANEKVITFLHKTLQN